MKSLVSIIIPTYNRAHLIEETLNSILAQTYTHWECIIVDDGSTDNTIDVIRKVIKYDSRFIVIKRPNNRKKGASSCRNIGIEKSKGNYIQFLDSDDILSSNKLNQQLLALENTSDLSFAFCKWGRFLKSFEDAIFFENLQVYNDFGNPILLLNSLIFSKGYLPIHSFLFRKNLVQKSGLWDENFSLNDDGEFFSRIIINFDEAKFTPNSFVLYRISENENTLSSYSNKQQILSVIESWKIIFIRYNSTFRGKEKKYIQYIKKGVYINVKKSMPELLNHTFFSGLKLLFYKERILKFFFKKINLLLNK